MRGIFNDLKAIFGQENECLHVTGLVRTGDRDHDFGKIAPLANATFLPSLHAHFMCADRCPQNRPCTAVECAIALATKVIGVSPDHSSLQHLRPSMLYAVRCGAIDCDSMLDTKVSNDFFKSSTLRPCVR